MRRLFFGSEEEPFTHYWDVSIVSYSYDEQEDLPVVDIKLSINYIEWDMGVNNALHVISAFVFNASNYEFLDTLIDWGKVDGGTGRRISDRDDSDVKINIRVESDYGAHLGDITLLYKQWRLKSLSYTSATAE